MKKSKLEKVSIYWWDGEFVKGQPVWIEYRLEAVVDNYVHVLEAGKVAIRKRLNYLEKSYGVKLPKVKWKKFLDEDGYLYRWKVNKS